MVGWLVANWSEVLGFVTGFVCVVLAARRNVWNYPIGIVNNLVFVWLFTSAGLYAAAVLQLVYLGFGAHGWWRWSHGAESERTFVARTPMRAVPLLVAAGIAGAAVLWWVLVTFTDSDVAVLDAATTSASLVAQYMLNRKWIENWGVWIGVDIVFAGLAVTRGLWMISALYLVFIGVCVLGWRSWRRVGADAARAGAVTADA